MSEPLPAACAPLRIRSPEAIKILSLETSFYKKDTGNQIGILFFITQGQPIDIRNQLPRIPSAARLCAYKQSCKRTENLKTAF